MAKIIKAFFILLLPTIVFGQKPTQMSSSEIELALKKLNVLVSVLYVAAHPDDENTRLIAYMSKERLANTAYLSMTRGDGGQNLIGPEIREYLGIIRTQELLGARRLDGGTQFFTRANDFGYSKSPGETQEIWDRSKVLEDVVKTIRKFKPDVIITRFPADGGGGHGHHTTSAILAREAFKLAGNENIYPDQVSEFGVWQPKRLYLNTGRWWNPDIDASEPGVLTVNVGEYNELLGESYTEIAAKSRSMHKSQGFGSSGSRGDLTEYLEYREGSKATDDIFEGIKTNWSRVKGGELVGRLISEAIAEFNPQKPYGITNNLIEIRKAIGLVKNDYWRSIKLKEVDNLIKNSLGLYLSVNSDRYYTTNGETMNLSFEMVNRSRVPVFAKRAVVNEVIADTTIQLSLNNNIRMSFNLPVAIENMETSQPYWLEEQGTLGTYVVKDKSLIGLPENPPSLTASITLNVLGEDIVYTVPVSYQWTDPVKGEMHRPLAVTPPVFVNISGNIHVFSSSIPKNVEVTVKAGKADCEGVIKLDMPNGWTVNPTEYNYAIKDKGAEEIFNFTITPPKTQNDVIIKAVAIQNKSEYDRGLTEINYDHFPAQVVFPKAEARMVKLDIKKYGERIGYIQGAGDDIPESLRNIGYQVTELSDNEITIDNLQKYDAVLLGIRALNTRERIAFEMQQLLNYVEQGGTLVVQYNTNRRLKTDKFSPFPLQLSRDRVTKEEAEVRIINTDHPVMNVPNKITEEDFDGWVQERGLYFPDEWSEEYTPVLSSNDPGESPKEGGLLVAQYGNGYYVYTGYSWFRELPAGVPGAYRIFANIVSLGNEKQSEIAE